MTNQVVEVHFASGPYRLFGKLRTCAADAPTILLLHGLGFHTFEYDSLAEHLAAGGFGSLAFDFRCHGRSEGPRGRWLLHDLVQDAVNALAFLSQRGDGAIGVFGNSLGALVGVHLAARAPKVGSLVASGCPTRVADFAVTPFRRQLLGASQALAHIVPIRISVNHFIPYQRILRESRTIDRVRGDALISDARRFAPSTFADMFAWTALPAVAKVTVPLLVLYAEHDGLQPAEQSTMLFDAARGQKEIRAIDTGHVPNLEEPELVAPILLDWFGRTLARPP